jgi:hypothetical protein
LAWRCRRKLGTCAPWWSTEYHERRHTIETVATFRNSNVRKRRLCADKQRHNVTKKREHHYCKYYDHTCYYSTVTVDGRMCDFSCSQ